MAQFSQLITTKQGQILIAKMLSGTNGITFTRIITSSTLYELNQLEDLTELGDIKQSALVSKVSRPTDTTVQVETAVKNDEVVTGYHLRSIGLYAIDPDAGEVLFAVTIETSGNCYMPAYNGVAVSGAYIKLVARVSNSEIVNLEVDPAGVATVGDVMNKLDFDSDISETVIETLEPIDTKYPIPAAGETTKVFMGKVKKYIEDTKPLDADMTVYVATTGSDITGDGTSGNPYETITYALSKIPKDLGGYTATLTIADGTYDEAVKIYGYGNGYLYLIRNGAQELNELCNIKSIRIEYCNNVSITGLNLTNTDGTSVFANMCEFVNMAYCQSIVTTATNEVSFNFDYVSIGRISGCRSLNHNICLRSYSSNVTSLSWTNDSSGNYGIFSDGGGRVAKGNIFQPRGLIAREVTPGGSIIVSNFGAKIGTLSSATTLYVATTGSDTTGDGTSGNPFRTIQYAIDILPKDFNAHSATITISSGTYNEDIVVSGFTGGLFQLTLSGNVTTGSITVLDSKLVCASTTVCTLTVKYIYVGESGRFDSFSNVAITTTGFITDQPLTGNKASIAANRGDIYISGPITLTGNTNIGISSISVSRIFFSTVSGGVFNVGLFVANGSVIYIGASNSISATTAMQRSGGGMIINPNGTQISDIISSGLSCTWGAISGGYRRIGNMSGYAQVVVNTRITLTQSLTAGNTYTIMGFPLVADGAVNIACAVDSYDRTKTCYLATSGSNAVLSFTPAINLSTGWTLNFSATYTTSA